MSLDFSSAGAQSAGGGLIPKNTVAFGTVEALNPAAERTSAAGNAYIDFRVRLTSGPFKNRIIFDRVFVRGSSDLTALTGARVKAILEANGASPQNLAGYRIANWGDLNGKRVCVRVGVDRDGKRNNIAAFLSPVQNPQDFAAAEAAATGASAQSATTTVAAAARPATAWR